MLKVTGADPRLVHHQETEILTTKLKRVDTSKSVRDLDHKNSYSLEDGMRLTADWMRQRLSVCDVFRVCSMSVMCRLRLRITVRRCCTVCCRIIRRDG